jgi:hypothetical protein
MKNKITIPYFTGKGEVVNAFQLNNRSFAITKAQITKYQFEYTLWFKDGNDWKPVLSASKESGWTLLMSKVDFINAGLSDIELIPDPETGIITYKKYPRFNTTDIYDILVFYNEGDWDFINHLLIGGLFNQLADTINKK